MKPSGSMKMTNLLIISAILSVGVFNLSVSIDLNDVEHYEVVQPFHINKRTRNKRDLSTNKRNFEHLDETIFEINTMKRQFVIHLQKNNVLIPRKIKMVHQDNNGKAILTKSPHDCYYHGYVYGESESSVTMTTCNGIRGLLQLSNGNDFFIEPMSNHTTNHVIYNMKNLKQIKHLKCGHDHLHDDNGKNGNDENQDVFYHQMKMYKISGRIRRKKRSNGISWSYLETIAVVDHRKYVALGNSLEDSQKKSDGNYKLCRYDLQDNERTNCVDKCFCVGQKR